MFTIKSLAARPATANSATTATHHLKQSLLVAATPATTATSVAKVAVVAVAAGACSEVDHPSLSPVQEAARRRALAQLEAHPEVTRAFTTRWEHDNLIVTLGIRGVGTADLMIPGARFGRDDLQAYGVLLECLCGVQS